MCFIWHLHKLYNDRVLPAAAAAAASAVANPSKSDPMSQYLHTDASTYKAKT